jgi:hypothetical protein
MLEKFNKDSNSEILRLLNLAFGKEGSNHLRFMQLLYNCNIFKPIMDDKSRTIIGIDDPYNYSNQVIIEKLKKYLND